MDLFLYDNNIRHEKVKPRSSYFSKAFQFYFVKLVLVTAWLWVQFTINLTSSNWEAFKCSSFSYHKSNILLIARKIMPLMVNFHQLISFPIRPTIIFITFWDFLMFYQQFLSPQVKRWHITMVIWVASRVTERFKT